MYQGIDGYFCEYIVIVTVTYEIPSYPVEDEHLCYLLITAHANLVCRHVGFKHMELKQIDKAFTSIIQGSKLMVVRSLPSDHQATVLWSGGPLEILSHFLDHVHP